jgi:hypothetical protein
MPGALLDIARFLDPVVGRANFPRFLFCDRHHRFRQTLRDQLVRVMLVHQAAVGLLDLVVGRTRAQAERLVSIDQAQTGSLTTACSLLRPDQRFDLGELDARETELFRYVP